MVVKRGFADDGATAQRIPRPAYRIHLAATAPRRTSVAHSRNRGCASRPRSHGEIIPSVHSREILEPLVYHVLRARVRPHATYAGPRPRTVRQRSTWRLWVSKTPNLMRTWSLRGLHQFLRLTLSALHVATASASVAFKSRATLQLENLPLRHQFVVLRRSVKRPKLTSADRLLWIWPCKVWSDWQSSPDHRQAGNRHCLQS
jgi:hypothetical protein